MPRSRVVSFARAFRGHDGRGRAPRDGFMASREKRTPLLRPDFRINDGRIWVIVGVLVLLFFNSGSLEAASRSRTQAPYIINNKRYYPLPSSQGFRQHGIASWYGRGFHGRRTSNGEIYNMYDMTAAHKILPMDTMVLVKNLENGRKTVVRVNDRGPFVRGRIIDLSYTAARKLGMAHRGIARVQITALGEKKVRKRGQQPTFDQQNLSVGEYYVQIGSFAQVINAVKLRKRFTDAGHNAVIREYDGPDGTLYRVQVYAGRTLANARRAEKALLDHGWTGCFVIAR